MSFENAMPAPLGLHSFSTIRKNWENAFQRWQSIRVRTLLSNNVNLIPYSYSMSLLGEWMERKWARALVRLIDWMYIAGLSHTVAHFPFVYQMCFNYFTPMRTKHNWMREIRKKKKIRLVQSIVCAFDIGIISISAFNFDHFICAKAETASQTVRH